MGAKTRPKRLEKESVCRNVDGKVPRAGIHSSLQGFFTIGFGLIPTYQKQMRRNVNVILNTTHLYKFNYFMYMYITITTLLSLCASAHGFLACLAILPKLRTKTMFAFEFGFCEEAFAIVLYSYRKTFISKK